MNLKHCSPFSRAFFRMTDGFTYIKTLFILLLLLVNDAEAEVDLICLFEVWLHMHHLRKRFFGMFKRAIAIIKYADAVPQFGFLMKVSRGQCELRKNLPTLGLRRW